MWRDPLLCGVIKFPVAAAERSAHRDSETSVRQSQTESSGWGLPAPHWCLYFVPLWSAPLIKATHNQSWRGEWQDSIWAWPRSLCHLRQEVPCQGHMVNLIDTWSKDFHRNVLTLSHSVFPTSLFYTYDSPPGMHKTNTRYLLHREITFFLNDCGSYIFNGDYVWWGIQSQQFSWKKHDG